MLRAIEDEHATSTRSVSVTCDGCKKMSYPDVPLLFDIEVDPSEASAITQQTPLLFNVDCGAHVLDRLTR